MNQDDGEEAFEECFRNFLQRQYAYMKRQFEVAGIILDTEGVDEQEVINSNPS